MSAVPGTNHTNLKPRRASPQDACCRQAPELLEGLREMGLQSQGVITQPAVSRQDAPDKFILFGDPPAAVRTGRADSLDASLRGVKGFNSSIVTRLAIRACETGQDGVSRTPDFRPHCHRDVSLKLAFVS